MSGDFSKTEYNYDEGTSYLDIENNKFLENDEAFKKDIENRKNNIIDELKRHGLIE